jgi:predicted DNA-binding protein
MKKKDIELTEEQYKKLHNLWFVYGNNGKKHTHHNHRYIQNILEHGEDTKDFYLNADKTMTVKAGIRWETIAITQECIDKVDEILKS